MSPRKYDMSRRAAATDATRRRIVEATAKLHGENGVFGASWQDIAREADVSVATVYKHFPSLEELLPACGALVMERARPPREGDAAEIVGDATTVSERLRNIGRELFAYYERGGPHLEVDARERQLPGMREWEESERATVSALVREALRGTGASRDTLQRVDALHDLPTFKALRTRGVSVDAAADVAAQLAAYLVERGAPAGKRSQAKEER